MRDRPFYEAGFHEVKGIRRVVIPFRRLLRRLLRPTLLHLDSELKTLAYGQTRLEERQNELDRRQTELDRRQTEFDQRQTQLDQYQHQLDGDMKAALESLHNHFDQELRALLAMGWDHVAIARRLAMLEDHVEALMSGEALGDPSPFNEGRPQAFRYSGEDDDQRAIGVHVKIH